MQLQLFCIWMACLVRTGPDSPRAVSEAGLTLVRDASAKTEKQESEFLLPHLDEGSILQMSGKAQDNPLALQEKSIW